jgi:AraC-like DNA-binding protein
MTEQEMIRRLRSIAMRPSIARIAREANVSRRYLKTEMDQGRIPRIYQARLEPVLRRLEQYGG